MKKSSTDGVFKSELTRATGSIIDYLNSDEDVTASEMIEKLEDLRDYMDDSIEQTGMELYSSYTFSCRFSEPEITGESASRISIRMARKTTLNRRQTMRQTIRKTVVSKGESVVRRSILRKGNNYFVDLGQEFGTRSFIPLKAIMSMIKSKWSKNLKKFATYLKIYKLKSP